MRKHDIFTLENSMLSSHVKRSLLLWLDIKSRLSQQKSTTVKWVGISLVFIVFSHDVTAAILVSQNNETAARFVSQTSPAGVEFFSYVNPFFCSNKFA